MKTFAALMMLMAIAPGVAADALDARIHAEDAERFAAVFEAADGAPTAEQLQRGYLDPGSRGVEVFTPGRIQNAANLAKAIARSPQAYRRGIDVCLPVAKAASHELRATYLAFEGLLGPDAALPEVYVVFGAGNSGGTAGPGAQVLGLEVICRIADSEQAVRDMLRMFFAHETVHTLQEQPGEAAMEADLLLAWALHEGIADLVATLVTGRVPDPGRAAWAEAREAELWAAFVADRKAVAAMPADARQDRDAGSRLFHWVGNAGSAPEGWPDELGYWVGMRIAEAWFDAAEDKRAAIRELLAVRDARVILEQSGYARRFATP